MMEDDGTPTLKGLRNSGRARWRRSDGIVMVEVCLTLIVLSVGLLAVFGLFSRGLERAAESEADTQIALFADNVLEGLHAAAMQAAEASGNPETGWTNFWGSFPTISVAASRAWLDEDDIAGIETPEIYPDVFVTNIYRNASLRGTNAMNIVNHALRYVIDITSVLPSGETNMHFVAVTLSVWPGEFGSTSAVPPRVFYTEYRKPDFF